MRPISIAARASALAMIGLLAFVSAATAVEVKVMSSGGFTAAYKELAPAFERKSGDTISTAWGPSMGTTTNAIPMRLKRGEGADVVIMVGYAVDDLIKQGLAVPGSRVDLAHSVIGMAVRAGAPKPDISSVDALKRTLLAAKSIAYSDSASGVYIQTELFKRLGIADAVKGKARMIPAEPVGAVVARGDAEIGFQQVSELKPVPGIDYVGPLPAEVQKVTDFSAGIVTGAKQPDAAKALIAYLSSPAAVPAIRKSGLEPVAAAE